MSELADALLEAHVQHELDGFRGQALPGLRSAWVGALFEWLGQVPLDRVANRAQIMGIIQRHVIDLKGSGGITELAGELSRLVFTSPTSATTRLDQVLLDEEYDDFAAKVVSLEGVRRGLIGLTAQSAAFSSIFSRLIARTLSGLLFRGAGLRHVAGGVAPTLERQVGRAVAAYFERHKAASHDAEQHMLEVLDPEWLRSLLDDIWAAVGPRPLAAAFAFIGEQDLEDFVVLGYGFWLRYRKSEYFRQVMEEMVDHFFTKYGEQSLLEMLEDMGVTEQMVAQELSVVLGPLLEEALQSGFLEQQVRDRLGPFYRSAKLEALLQKP